MLESIVELSDPVPTCDRLVSRCLSVTSGLRQLLSNCSLPSLAGRGLPERLRSTTFALLGLTAASCLALVAVFAQPGWPILSTGPLPSPPRSGSIGEAAPLTAGGQVEVALAPLRTAPAAVDRSLRDRPPRGRSGGADGLGSAVPTSADAVRGPAASTGSPEPIPEAVPEPSPPPVETSPDSGSEIAAAPVPSPGPAADPADPAAPSDDPPGRATAEAPPKSSAAPGKSAAAPGHNKPSGGKPSSNGRSSAAPGHTKSPTPPPASSPAAPASAPPAPPAPPAAAPPGPAGGPPGLSPGNGKGHANGHYK
jgi:hypothetical protein